MTNDEPAQHSALTLDSHWTLDNSRLLFMNKCYFKFPFADYGRRRHLFADRRVLRQRGCGQGHTGKRERSNSGARSRRHEAQYIGMWSCVCTTSNVPLQSVCIECGESRPLRSAPVTPIGRQANDSWFKDLAGDDLTPVCSNIPCAQLSFKSISSMLGGC